MKKTVKINNTTFTLNELMDSLIPTTNETDKSKKYMTPLVSELFFYSKKEARSWFRNTAV